MKKILVTQRIDYIKLRSEYRDAIDQRLLTFLFNCGYLAFSIPNFSNDCTNKNFLIDNWLKSFSFDGILLSGGNDINEFLIRDNIEKLLISYSIKNNVPLFGICRGMQMIALYLGSKLKKVEGHVRTRHKLKGELDFEVNSFHNYSIDYCPSSFKILARSLDDQIEAISHKKYPWKGCMWHPEREDKFTDYDKKMIQSVFK